MRFGSLFAGIGGIDLGLERAGMECAWQVENDEWCNRVLSKHWPDVPRFGDIRTLNVSDLEPVDLVAGGFPCQPVSLAGKQQAQADERWLWPEFARVLRALRPRYAILENVPGLLTANQGRAAQEIFGDLAEHGYDAEWASIPAAAVGAPHLRYRVFVVARLAGTDAERERLQVPSQRDGRTEDGIEAGTFWDYLDRLRDPVADTEREGRGQWAGGESQEGGRTQPANGGEALADADGEAWNPAWTTGQEVFGSSPLERVGRCSCCDGNHWTTEPDVGRVVARIPPGLDGGVNAHVECITKARAAGVPQTVRLRVLQEYLKSSEASSQPARCSLCGHPMSSVSCQGACAPWRLGARTERAEDLRCMQEGVLQLLSRQGEDVQSFLSLRAWSDQREQTLGKRVDRLRGLGNAVVPQVAEWVGRRIMEAT